jgi:AcrR family transcriptional regulator
VSQPRVSDEPRASDPPRVNEQKQRLPAAVRRTQLLEVALEQFAARGFHDTSMEEIAEAAGVTKPVLYQHFSSKRKLYLELLDSEGQRLLADVAGEAAAAVNPYQRVLAGFRAYFRFVSERTSSFQLLFGSGARRTDEFAECVSRVEEAVAEVIAGFIDADIDSAHRQLLGYAIVGLGEVAGRWWVALRPEVGPSESHPELPVDAEVLAVRLADLVWAGLRGLPGSAGRQASVS